MPMRSPTARRAPDVDARRHRRPSPGTPRQRLQRDVAIRAPGEGSTTLISAVTVVALVALWWLASHLRWLPPLFLPTPEVVFAAAVRIGGGRADGRAAGRALRLVDVPRLHRLLARLRDRHSDRHRDGRVARAARHLRSADRVLPAAAAARVPAADRHLVRHRRAVEGRC